MKCLPMGKTFKDHFGEIELPSEILGVQISNSSITFNCENGTYFIFFTPQMLKNKPKIKITNGKTKNHSRRNS